MSLNSLRLTPSAWGTQATDDAIDAIKSGWNKTMVGLYEERLKAGAKEFKHRRQVACSTNAILEGKFEGLVARLLQSRYDQKTYVKLAIDSGISMRINIMRDVLDKADVTVAEGCDYSLVRRVKRKPIIKGKRAAEWAAAGAAVGPVPPPDTKPTQEENPPEFDTLIEKMHFDATLQRISRLCWVHKAVACGPAVKWCDRIGKRALEMCILTPDRFDLVSLDPNSSQWDVFVVYTCDEDGKDTERVLWSASGYTEQVWNKEQSRWQTEEEGPNPYGQIPFVVFKPFPDQLWWNECHGPLLNEATIQANSAETFIDYLMSGQVKVPIGQFDGTPGGQTLMHGQPVNGGATATGSQMWDFQLDIGNLIANYVTRERTQAAQALGLSGAEWDNANTPPSGTAMQMKFWARDKGAVARRTWLLPLAVELYWLTMRVLWEEIPAVLPGQIDGMTVVQTWPIDGFDGGWVSGNTWTPVNPKEVLPPFDANTTPENQTYQLRIDPRDVSYPVSISDQIEQEEYDLSMGFTSRSQLLRDRNSDVNLADAPAEIERNLAEEMRYQKMGKPATPIPIGASATKVIGAIDPTLEATVAKPSDPPLDGADSVAPVGGKP